MKRTNSKDTPMDFARALAVLAIVVGALPAAFAGPDTTPAKAPADPVGSPPELIQSQAKQLTESVRDTHDKDYGLAWRGGYTPKFGIVGGREFQQAVDRINRLATECDRQIATDQAHVKAPRNKEASACVASLRKIRNEVFNLRTNATRVWSPASGGYNSYMVDVNRLGKLTARLARLAEACRQPTGEDCGCDHPVSDLAGAKVAQVNTSLIW